MENREEDAVGTCLWVVGGEVRDKDEVMVRVRVRGSSFFLASAW